MSIDWLQMLRGLLLKVMPLCYSSKRLNVYLSTIPEGQMRLYIQQTAKLYQVMLALNARDNEKPRCRLGIQGCKSSRVSACLLLIDGIISM